MSRDESKQASKQAHEESLLALFSFFDSTLNSVGLCCAVYLLLHFSFSDAFVSILFSFQLLFLS